MAQSDYTKFKRGSEWRKWDLHIHTPETKKNDLFEGSTPKEKWDKFIDTINKSKEPIAVIGITDYFSIDTYFKFKQYVSDGVITKQFDLIIPNIEIRVVPTAASGTPINLHCIFNPSIDAEIESRFLSKLDFEIGGSNYSAKKEEFIRLGKNLPGKGALDDFAALKEGIGQYVVTIDTLRKIFEKDADLRDNTIIAVSNKSSDGASGLRHSDFFTANNGSQLDATRWSIYQFCDAIFSSNAGDILYFLGKGVDSKETVIEKCEKLMPCFHGCDAHSNDKVFAPSENRFCWIKADPTFEGLKQVLFEPGDRVKIQALKPDPKNERYVISELRFTGSGNLFGNQSILLNENLNSIIGGKSSGKSLLLFSTAKSIDPEQVERTSKRLKFDGYSFTATFGFDVIWKNGDVDKIGDMDSASKLHKITYIPQLYINHLVEKNNKEELNSLVESILLQDSTYRDFFDARKKRVSDLSTDIEKLLTEYLQVRTKGLEIQKKSEELGKSEPIRKGIDKLNEDILRGQQTSNLTELEKEQYNKLLAERSQLEKNRRSIELKEQTLKKLHEELHKTKTSLFGQSENANAIIKGQIDKIISDAPEHIEELTSIRTDLLQDFDLMLVNLESRISQLNISESKTKIVASLLNNTQQIEPLNKKLAGQSELQKLIDQGEKEKIKLQEALNLESQLRDALQEYANIRQHISTLLQTRYSEYNRVVTHINETKKEIGSGIQLSCDLRYRKDNFSFYDQVNKAALSEENIFHSFFSGDFVNYDGVPSFFNNQLRVTDDRLFYEKDKEKFIPLRVRISLEEILRGLIADNFYFDFAVTYGGDDLLQMSPGKKGTVLLILFLQISSAEYPILIDQPEDNLDNRTIYELLCKMIKEKKKDRQILIVSHNANLVVATDSENIIVANQEGQGRSLEVNQFQYLNGALEHSFSQTEPGTDLRLRGIKEHVCDILEGGNEAFKQRERKYAIK